MKKKIILGAASVASIIAPVAAVVACGSDTHHSLDYDATKPLVGNTTGKDFFENKDVYKETFNSNLSKYDKQVSFVLYDQEVEAAYNLQLGDFEFKKFKKQQELTKVKMKKADLKKTHDAEKDDAKKKSLQTQIDAKANEIKDLTTAIDKLDKNIKTATDKKVDFDSSSLGSDFPLLLKPFINIKKAKEKYFQDQKDQFFKTFGPNEGAKKWPEEIRKKFGGSENKKDAIIWLASNEIRNVAKGAFSFRINNQYTVEQYIWAVVTGNKHWTFLSNDKDANALKLIHINSKHIADVAKTLTNDKDKLKDPTKNENIAAWDKIDYKSEKVYFISSNGKTVFPMGEKNEGDFITKKVTLSHSIKVQNGIMPFVRTDNVDEAWKIKADQLKKLLYSYGTGQGKKGYELLLDDKLYEDEKFTTMALQMGTTDSTSKIQGSLGIKETLEYIRTMKPGFGLGVLRASAKKIPLTKQFDVSAFATQMEATLTKLYGDYQVAPPAAGATPQIKNQALDKLFDAAKGKIELKFGATVREYFASITDKSFAYKIGNKGHIIVFSTFGIHIIKITGFTDVNALKADVKKDLEHMAKEQDQSSSTGVISLINSHFAKNYEFLKEIVNKANNDATFKKSLEDRFKEYNASQKELIDKGTMKELKFDSLVIMRERIENYEKTKKVTSSLTSSQINWYKKQLDNHLKDPSLTIDALYELAKEVA